MSVVLSDPVSTVQVMPVRHTLPRVRRRYGRTIMRNGATRRECWGARTDDGVWDLERVDDVGTPWQVVYVPTGEGVSFLFTTLRKALTAISTGLAESQLPSRLAMAHHTHQTPAFYCPGCHPDGNWRFYVPDRKADQ